MRIPLIAVGFTSIIAQVVLMRELVATFYGNELPFGLVLRAWVAAGSWGLGRLTVRRQLGTGTFAAGRRPRCGAVPGANRPRARRAGAGGCYAGSLRRVGTEGAGSGVGSGTTLPLGRSLHHATLRCPCWLRPWPSHCWRVPFTGMAFPLAVALIQGNVGRVAGMLYGADLVGGCLGALLGAVLLVPVLGIPQTYAAIALVGLTGLLVLV